MIRFQSFSSGSCGNACMLSYDRDDGSCFRLLIDAGVSVRRLKKTLSEEGMSLSDISAVLITHDHFDHVRHLGAYCKYIHPTVYAPSRLMASLRTLSVGGGLSGASAVTLETGVWTDLAEGVSVFCFDVPHDATQTVGYALRLGSHRYLHLTDLGEFKPVFRELASKADTVTIESNFDVDMLLGGSYPAELKARISRGAGHLSNDDCAAAIRSFFHPGLKNIFLCHLSGNNNTPAKAVACAREALMSMGEDAAGVSLRYLPRGLPTALYNL